MRAGELGALIVELIGAADHPEVVAVRGCDALPALARTEFASGSQGTVLLRHVARGAKESTPWETPGSVA